MSPCPRRRFLRGCTATLGLTIAGCLDSNGITNIPPGTETQTKTQTDTTDRTQTIQTEPPVVWQRTLGSAITTPPISTGSTLYVGTESGTVESVAAATGSRWWSYDADTIITASPVLIDDTVFVVAGENELFANHGVVALDAKTGTEQWTFTPEEWWLEILDVTEDLLYVGTADDAIGKGGQTLYALSVTDGSVQWSSPIGDPSGGILVNEMIYVPTYGRLYAYNAKTGEQQWTRDVEDYSHRTIAAIGGTVCYVTDEGDTRGKLVALESETGETRWSHDKWMATSTTLHEATLYVGGEHVAAFDLASGEQHWQAEQSGFVPQVPVQDGVLYAGGDTVRAYDSGDGTVGWTWTPKVDVEGLTPAAVVEDSVYVDSWRRDEPRRRFKFGLDATAGEHRWVFENGTEFTNLSYDKTQAYVGAGNGVVYALR